MCYIISPEDIRAFPFVKLYHISEEKQLCVFFLVHAAILFIHFIGLF